MLFEIILVLIMIIVILVIVGLFSNIHIMLVFKNNNKEYVGDLHLKFMMIKLFLDFRKQQLDINLFGRAIKTINLAKDDEKVEEDDDDFKINNILGYKKEILEVISYLPRLIKFKKSDIKLNLSLADYELTLKACAIIWSIAAVLYPAGLILQLKPCMGEFKIESQICLEIDVITLNIVRFIIKLVSIMGIKNILNMRG